MFACAGAVLGGVAGTLDWPVVSTFFGAIAGAGAGAAVGVVDGLALVLLALAAASPWPARVVSGLVSGVAATLAVWAGDGRPFQAPSAPQVVVIMSALLLGGAVGPLVADGRPVLPGGRPADAALGRVVGRVVAAGAALGGVIGGVAGGIIGASSYLPTAPFAVVEGAVLGAVSGAVVGCAVAGAVVVLPVRATPDPRIGASGGDRTR